MKRSIILVSLCALTIMSLAAGTLARSCAKDSGGDPPSNYADAMQINIIVSPKTIILDATKRAKAAKSRKVAAEA